MSADDWQGCPVCNKLAYEYYEYAKDKLPYNTVKEVESKFNHIDKQDEDSWSPDLVQDYDGDDEKLIDIVDWVETSIDTGTPVRIDYCYSISGDGTYGLDFSAVCHNCGHTFTEEKE